MNGWGWLRIAIVAISFVQGIIQPSSLGEASDWKIAVIFLFFPIVAILFVIGIQFVNPFSAPTWERPRWTTNPFQFRQPLQFFHLGGYASVADGLGTLVNALFTGTPLFDAVPFILLGVGTVIGVSLCTVAYRRRMEHDA
jgi:hypothetical protein